MAVSKMIRGEQRWFLIALGIVVVLGVLYFALGLDRAPTENIDIPATAAPSSP